MPEPPSTEDTKIEKEYLLPSDESITNDVKRKMEIIGSLIEPCDDRLIYRRRKEEAARKLNVSIRSVERLLKKYREQGLVGLTKNRSDKGKLRISEDWQEFIKETFKKGNKDGRRITRHQVFLKVKGRARQLGLSQGEFPSHQTVYDVLDQYVEEKERKKKARSPGFIGSGLTHVTRDGRELEVEGSNDVWQCDHTLLDVMLVDEYGVLSRPWLTIIIDSYSRCLMGYYLGFESPSSQVDALALRHAILPKSYSSKYELRNEWNTYGLPTYFYTDGGKDFRSIHITEQVAIQLGFNCFLRRRPNDGGIVERFFRTLNDSVLRELPGYTGGNVQERPETVDKDACLTLSNLEKILLHYIVDEYNQKADARMQNQTRIFRWESGLLTEPYLFNERELDICLMKGQIRSVQKYGTIQFSNLPYKSAHLRGHEKELVSIRFDPEDITTILVYERLPDGTEKFLDYAHAQGLEQERISLREWKAISEQLKKENYAINSNTISDAIMEREALVEKITKQNRQQRKKAAHEQVNPVKSIQEKLGISVTEEIEKVSNEDEIELPTFPMRYMDDNFEED